MNHLNAREAMKVDKYYDATGLYFHKHQDDGL